MRTPTFIAGALLLLGAALPLTGVSAQDAARNAPAAAAASGGADVGTRLQRVEEQIVDLSAQLGTVETMARASTAAPTDPSAAAGGGDAGRIAQLETEVRALSAQVSELLQRLQQLDGRSGGLAPAPQSGGNAMSHYSDGGQPAGDGRSAPGGAAGGFSADVEPAQPAPKPAQKKSSGGLFGLFGGGSSEEENSEPESLTPSAPVQPRTQPVQPMSGGGIAPAAPDRGASAAAPDRAGASSSAPPMRQAQVQAAVSPGQAKALYDSAFIALQEGNHKAAAEGFDEFVQRYPTDAMAGSAHFWLGEASFTNGEYRKAADNFLKTATDFPQSEKAAESLFKLGVSLKRLNENDAACSTFGELARRYPNAGPLLQRADAEKRRAKCP